mmetsp:Transcript_13089/g.39570  ORF Transcript_13089/g.39570 Transcript_13089/m.39570 type:complete len:232 (+) Transcript_13089:539-1234(+)
MRAPAVSTPRLQVVSSRMKLSEILPDRKPLTAAAWTAAPLTAASSRLVVLRSLSSWWSKKDERLVRTWGMRVEPPTKRISCTRSLGQSASRSARSTQRTQRAKRSWLTVSNWARVSVSCKPVPSAKRSSTSTRVSAASESSRFARSQAAVTRRRALPLRCVCWNFWAKYSTTRRVKASPPTRVSEAVARISTMPSSTSSNDTSNAPPPKSKTSKRVGSSSPRCFCSSSRRA